MTHVRVEDGNGFEKIEARAFDGKILLSTKLISQTSSIETKGHGVFIKYTNIFDQSGTTIIDIQTSLEDENGNKLKEDIRQRAIQNDGTQLQLVNIVDINHVILIQEWRFLDDNETVFKTMLTKTKDSVFYNNNGTFFETLLEYDTDGESIISKSAIEFINGEYIELGTSDIKNVNGAIVEVDD